MRWIGSLVAEAYRILGAAAIYLYPGDERPGYRNGRLRLVYEANPIAFIVEQAGGAATDGRERDPRDAAASAAPARAARSSARATRWSASRDYTTAARRRALAPIRRTAACSGPEGSETRCRPTPHHLGHRFLGRRHHHGQADVRATSSAARASTAAFIEGDAFHRYDRAEMEPATAEARQRGNNHFSHFGEEANLLRSWRRCSRDYGESGRGRTRHYVHDEREAQQHGAPAGTFTAWEDFPRGTDLLFYEGLHGAVVTPRR